ncbi:MAG TPA: lysylphosphatidylglycerol synthase transmembrane domain-containing protein [Candidatus Saccharimonadales bacterium]|nr:lysylphosphatidylglycerol synthase transmembrane domain-containing protein [Candidatus Saccharimonadales bacterium]
MKLASKKLSLAITAIVLVAFIAYFLLNIEKFRPLLHVNIGLLFLIALADMISIGVNGLFTKAILVPFKKSIGFMESYYVSLISTVGNFFAPVGAGFAFRAVYLKKKHSLPYSEYVSTLSGNYILVFLVSSILGLVSLFLLRDDATPQLLTLAVVFSLLLVMSLILSLIKLPLFKVDSVQNKYLRRIGRILFRIINGWNKITSNKALLLKLFGLTLANAVLSFILIWLIIMSLHLTVTFPALLLLSVLGTLSLFINITPANLGIKEAIYIFSSGVLGFTVSQIILIALIDRGIVFLVLLGLWLFFGKIHKQSAVLTENSKSS